MPDAVHKYPAAEGTVIAQSVYICRFDACFTTGLHSGCYNDKVMKNNAGLFSFYGNVFYPYKAQEAASL